MHRIGLDIGSTTIKTVVLDETGMSVIPNTNATFPGSPKKPGKSSWHWGKNFPENTDSASLALPGSA